MGQSVILKMEHIYKSFGDVEVIHDFNMEVTEGEKVVFAGASGSGKTTILRMINYLERPTKGTVWIDGTYIGGYYDSNNNWKKDTPKNICEKRKQIGMVFQSFNLFSHLNALQNVSLGPIHSLGVAKKEAEERAEHYLEQVHLKDHMKKFPHQMSGGQQQRVAIARALAMKPKLILFDEPTSALDPKLTTEVLDVMQELTTQNLTMLVVTHEMGFARNFADRILYLEGGVVIEEGPPEQIFTAPQREETKNFLSFCGYKEGEF